MRFATLFLALLPFLVKGTEGSRHQGGRGLSKSFGSRMGRGMGSGWGPGSDQTQAQSEPAPDDNNVEPMLPMDGAGAEPAGKDGAGSPPATGGTDPDPFSVSIDGKVKQVVFRLSNRLAVAVCDTYDRYLATGKPHQGQIMYNITVQELRSKVDPTVCQSFKIKRCGVPAGLDVGGSEACGWTKVPTC